MGNLKLLKISGEKIKDENGKEVISMKERIYYPEFIDIMLGISIRKRKMIKEKMKNYCKYIEKN